MSRILETVDEMILDLQQEAERENVFRGRAAYAVEKLVELRFRLALTESTTDQALRQDKD